MRRHSGSLVLRRATLAFVIVLVVALLVPAMAPAAGYRATIRSSSASVYANQVIALSGIVTPSATGKTMYIERRKKGALLWSSARIKVGKNSRYSYRYKPTTAGTYYFRARTGANRSSAITVVAKAQTALVLASTTSTQDSGLFEVLIPAFNRSYPQYRVKIIAVGSGEAMEIGKRKDADTLLVHSPAAEAAFVADGYGRNRTPVMYNDFVLVGPDADPAKTTSKGSIIDCLKAIKAAESNFISRGDNSGTHAKEKALWTLAGGIPNPSTDKWYFSVGQGMGETLRIAGEKPGYTLADRATWLTNKPAGLKIVQQGDANLYNQYSVIDVVGAKNRVGAERFRKWIIGDYAQMTVIRNFGVKKYGQRLFTPNAP
jgi:tungstate transport system substrate-binding protein